MYICTFVYRPVDPLRAFVYRPVDPLRAFVYRPVDPSCAFLYRPVYPSHAFFDCVRASVDLSRAFVGGFDTVFTPYIWS